MALCCASGSSHGLGFGRPTSRAILGDTLSVNVAIRLEAGEDITNECLAADVYFGDDKVAASAVSVSILGSSPHERTLKVSTSALVNEPVVTVYLAAGCKARITRKFVTFADPPGMALPQVADASPIELTEQIQSATIPASAVVSKPSALSAAMNPTRPAARAEPLPGTQAAPQPLVRPQPKRVMASAPSTLSGAPSMALSPGQGQAKRAKPAPRQAQLAAADPAVLAPNAPRLVLDPVEMDAIVAPELRMAASLNAPAGTDAQAPSADIKARRETAAAMWLALNATPDQLLRDRQRLQELEQRLSQLTLESEQAQSRLAAMQTKAAQADGGAHSERWLTLMTFVAFCALALVVYLYQQLRAHKRRQAEWWQSQAEVPGGVLDAEPQMGAPSYREEAVHTPLAEAGTAAAQAGVPAAHRADVARQAYGALGAEHAPGAEMLNQLVPDAMPPAARSSTPITLVQNQPPEPLREVSVEELIDLEQQAEFFVVLGQDDAAIGLLEGHVHSTSGASPLPFLKLLEIYRRLDRRADYERVQGEFNKHFNAFAPTWDSDFQHGHTLVDYPGVVERLQALWPSPAKAMEVLEKSLSRPDNGAEPFELPAYRELLFLYAVARDLSERDAHDRNSVDLLLPVMDFSGHEPVASVHGEDTQVQPLMATRPVQAHPEASPSLSLDLQLDDLPDPVSPQRP